MNVVQSTFVLAPAAATQQLELLAHPTVPSSAEHAEQGKTRLRVMFICILFVDTMCCLSSWDVCRDNGKSAGSGLCPLIRAAKSARILPTQSTTRLTTTRLAGSTWLASLVSGSSSPPARAKIAAWRVLRANISLQRVTSKHLAKVTSRAALIPYSSLGPSARPCWHAVIQA